MRLPLPCVHCTTPVPDAPAGTFSALFVFVELEGEHRFRITCPKGHTSVIGLRQPRFKILFESGAHALLDGYYREAVATFASSLERFHEYWLRATCLEQGVPVAAFDETWKHLSRQSERQFGAFLVTYLRARGVVPSHLPPKLVEFRNEVVHKGAFPTSAETHAYAEQVMRLIARLNRELSENCPNGVAAVQAELEAAISRDGAQIAAITTMVGRATDMLPAEPPFSDELNLADARRMGKGVA